MVFWTSDVKILFENGKFLEIIPRSSMTRNEKLNSITRFLIYLTILLLLFSNNNNYVFLCIIIILLIVIIGNTDEKSIDLKENFCEDGLCEINKPCQKPTFNNPLMNVSLMDYIENPKRPPAYPITDEIINDKVNQFMDFNVFWNVSDPFGRNFFYRQFYTMPSTTIPNDQTAFAESLFRQPESCKINPANCYRYEDIRFNRINPALDGAKEIFYRDPFGNFN